MKAKSIKTLVVSILAIITCFAMLLGTTFAWFTDSVNSSSNIISSGNIKLNAYWMDATDDPTEESNWIEFNGSPIFNYDNWEPGYVEAKHIRITNEGTLAFKYKVDIIPNGVYSDLLASVIDVYVLTSAQETNRATITAQENYVGTLKEVIEMPNDTGNAKSGAILPVGSTPNNASLEVVGSDTVSIAFKMQEEVGNDYENLSIGTDFDIIISATQYSFEEDDFGSDYDKDAEFPFVDTAYVPANNGEITLTAGDVSVTIPAFSPSGAYRLETSKLEIKESDAGNSVSTNIDLFHGNNEADNSYSYKVEINVGTWKDITKVMHGDREVENYDYDPMVGVVSFTTNSFSSFTIESKVVSYDAEINEDGDIIAGTFINVNPAEYDAQLKEENSEYIAINYEQNGKTLYLVSERATTVVLGGENEVATLSENGGYVAENGNYNVNAAASGKLASIISGLQNNEHSTVCLLPGTYNEASTIYVYSSMDIIGLGDKDSVKVIKAYSTGSNQHLFNCAGQKEDYIQVTLRNLYLDASEYNYKKATDAWGRDNAAVQSIRKSKVKCYDLTVVKNATKSDQYAFYVNANNDANGAYQNAYMYVENCELTVRGENQVLSTKTNAANRTKCYFYHSGLVYNGVLYTTNNSTTKNISMDANDWDWEN